MGFRSKPAIPGILIAIVGATLLAIVSFNTPLLKSQYFLQANYSTGQYAGSLRLGTLGYCLTGDAGENCVGPTVGYNFNPNTLLGVTQFNIPEAITKYLTYVLIVHVVALAFIVASILFALLSLCSISVLCFPVLFASLASSFALIGTAVDLAMFYIAKARIDAVSGASATIGISVWLTLASWLICGFAACCYGVGSCCCGTGARAKQSSGDPKGSYNYDYNRAGSMSGPDRMRLDALRDEELRKKEQGLPNFQTLETTPLTSREEDRYLDNNDQHQSQQQQYMPGGLRRDPSGSLVNGVGVGYGRRTGTSTPDTVGYHVGYAANTANPWDRNNGDIGYGGNPALIPPQAARGTSGSDVTSNAGHAGLGAGHGGVDMGYGYYGQQRQTSGGYDNAYGDVYGNNNANTYNDPYGQNQNQPQHQYPPIPKSTSPQDPYRTHTADPYSQNQSNTYDPYNNNQRISSGDPYGGYEDDHNNNRGIGTAITAPIPVTGNQYQTQYSSNGGYSDHQIGGGTGPTIHTPQPQHLISQERSELLRSPVSVSDVQSNTNNHNQGYDSNSYGYGHQNQLVSNTTGGAPYQSSMAGVSEPPSYGVAVGGSGSGSGSGSGTNPNTNTQSNMYRPEKAGYH